ncbi:outer membrane protein [Dyella tabacisoli]|nr:outer membrane beta-barrel protein [Dyella tabacisoli]
MKKTLIAAALAVASVSSFAAAASENNQLDNFFVAGNLGKSDFRTSFDHKNSVFQNVRFGWRWNGIVGAEVGYAYLGRPKSSDGITTLSAKTQAATIGVNAKYDFYQNWYVTGHGGYLRSHIDAKLVSGGSSISEKSWNNGWYAGVGVGYNLTKDVSLGINYDNYHVKYGRGGANLPQDNVNVATYSASVEYRF